MAEDTDTISLGGEWQQLSDGESSVFVQVLSGLLEYVSAGASPPEEKRGHIAAEWKEFTITPPTQIWARAAGRHYVTLAFTIV